MFLGHKQTSQKHHMDMQFWGRAKEKLENKLKFIVIKIIQITWWKTELKRMLRFGREKLKFRVKFNKLKSQGPRWKVEEIWKVLVRMGSV